MAKFDNSFLSAVIAPLAKTFEVANSQAAKSAGIVLPPGAEAAYVEATKLLKPLILRKLAKKFSEMMHAVATEQTPLPPAEAIAKVRAALTAAMREAGQHILVVRSGDTFGVITCNGEAEATFDSPDLIDDGE